MVFTVFVFFAIISAVSASAGGLRSVANNYTNSFSNRISTDENSYKQIDNYDDFYLRIEGTIDDFTHEEMVLLMNSIQTARNEIFSGTEMSIKNLHTLNQVDMSPDWGTNTKYPPPPLCYPDCVDDDTIQLAGKEVMSRILTGKVRILHRDDRLDTVKAEGVMHQAFEKSLCEKLRASGRENFSNIEGCTFHWKPTSRSPQLDNHARN